MRGFVAHPRVSTDRQGRSGLGLEARRRRRARPGDRQAAKLDRLARTVANPTESGVKFVAVYMSHASRLTLPSSLASPSTSAR
jgi:hypothetical protein